MTISAISIAEHVAHDLNGLDTIASAVIQTTLNDPEQVARIDVVTQGGRRFLIGVSFVPEGVEVPL